MSLYGYHSYETKPWFKRPGPWIGIAVTTAVLVGGFIFLEHVYDFGSRMWQGLTIAFWDRSLFPSGLSPAAWTGWGYLIAALAVSIILLVLIRSKKTAGIIASVVAIIALILAVAAWWDNDKDGARSYSNDTVFAVSSLGNIPTSLRPLAEGAQHGAASDTPSLVGTHNVPARIIEQQFDFEWEQRVASRWGAEIVMTRTSGSVPNTYLMSESMSYTYGNDGTGAWTAIRDGHNRIPVWGVISMDGSGDPLTTCEFKDANELNYSFDGMWGHNLADLIAGRYRHLLYNQEDIWGYCDGDKPIIVIPVMQQEAFGHRTTVRSAGVLVITGSPSGTPVFEHRPTVGAGELPGPVYSSTLVNHQVAATQWAAGRGNMNRLQFGFEETNVTSQAGNSGNYLLRNKKDGRIYWVTPLTPRSSDSQQLTAFSVTPADEANGGGLNQLTVYVAPDDQRVANLDDLLARVEQAIITSDPGFFTGENAGRIVEFLPLDGETWQVYAERSGRVMYYITINVDERVRPQVFDLQVDEEEEAPMLNCDPSADLSAAEVADCIVALTNKLRQQVSTQQ